MLIPPEQNVSLLLVSNIYIYIDINVDIYIFVYISISNIYVYTHVYTHIFWEYLDILAQKIVNENLV